MKSNYKRIGKYIRLVDERNEQLKVKTLLGLSISKEFIPSVANIIGTDMANYKIIRKNQFACSTMQVRRDGKMPVALLKDFEEAIISPAYPVFEIIDPAELIPEYLMMWMTRSEFDREACFYAIGGVRGSLEWEDFCDMQLPVPHPDKQRELVKEYNTIVNRINLNNQLIQKLEETAQAIYKQWFVDFEFPDENGQPYKSSGGEMEESQIGYIPKYWALGNLGNIMDVINGYAFSSGEFHNIGDFPIIKIANIESPRINLMYAQYYKGELSRSIERSTVEKGDVLISMTGSHMNQINSAVGKVGRYNYLTKAVMNQRVSKLSPKLNCREFLYRTIIKEETQTDILTGATGSANQANISPQLIKSIKIVIPPSTILDLFECLIAPQISIMQNFEIENRSLENMRTLILSKLATSEL